MVVGSILLSHYDVRNCCFGNDLCVDEKELDDDGEIYFCPSKDKGREIITIFFIK